jgi:hypothetical protein
MECTSLRDVMMETLYGESSREASRRLEEHCAACADCMEELRALKRLRQDLAAWRLPETSRPRLRLRPTARVWALAAAAALLLASGTAIGLGLAEVRFSRLVDQRDARLRDQMALLRDRPAVAPAHDDRELLARMTEMIEESEARQAERLRAGLTEVVERSEAQRRYDLARVSAGLSYLDERNGQSMARATELMGYVLQASQQR